MSKVKRADRTSRESTTLRRGWTTGACATAATKAALTALVTGVFPDPVVIKLPKGETPAFVLAKESLEEGCASASIVKDAGDDPDVTHGALITATVRYLPAGTGIVFRAGEGVGIVTKPGLPLPPGEPAINPVPRKMMIEVVEELAASLNLSPDVEIMISVAEGEKLAERTWNPRLGIKGGISILGTTGIVHPFSCSAWIHSIHRGVDVCRANGLNHAIAATGSTSEEAARSFYPLPVEALLDMGDFAGGLLKYLRNHPIPRLTLAGGFAKFAKLAQGAMDLHSGRSQVDLAWLASQASDLGATVETTEAMANANTALEALTIAGPECELADRIALLARKTALNTLKGAPVDVEVMIISRDGKLIGRSGEFDA